MRTLHPQRGVVAMPRVDPGVVVKLVKQFGGHVVKETLEIGRVGGFPHASRKEAIAGEQVGMPGGVGVVQSNRTGSVPHQMDGGELTFSELDNVPVRDSVSHHRNLGSISLVGDRPSLGYGHDVL